MKKVLVAYTTNSGSTEEVARAIGEELGRIGVQVDVLRLDEVTSIEPYVAVVVGAPMIMGWHRAAVKFVKEHQKALSQVRVAYFIMAMSLTQLGETHIGNVPVYIDPELPVPPKKAGHLGFKERYATAAKYLRPVLNAAPQVKPVSVGFFGGDLALYRLKLLQMLFVLLVIQAPAGDKRNWPAIREWAAGLQAQLLEGENI